MSAEHTPHTAGVWQVNPSGNVTVELPEGEYFLAECDVDSSLAEAEQLANARLMAAAPQLKAALLNLMTAYGQVTRLGQPNLDPVWLDAKAAIDTSEGHQ